MSITRKKKKDDEKVKFGYSELTLRLLGPSQTGEAGNVNLPWSCAIYSIVNWMVAFTDVEGIQVSAEPRETTSLASTNPFLVRPCA